MSASITSGSFPQRAAPGAGTALQGAGRAVWRFLLAVGAARARPHLELLAQRYERSDPALARRLRESSRELLLG